MEVGNNSYYDPDEALHELAVQEQILNTAIDVQALLGLLVHNGIITKEEIDTFRDKVRSISKYKMTIDEISRQKKGFKSAKDNSQDYLRAIFHAKMDGKIK